jgi:hypothetical protein
MRLRLVLGSLLALLCIAPAVAFAGPKLEPTTKSVLIAKGEFFGEPARITAFDSTVGVCVKELNGPAAGPNLSCNSDSSLGGGELIEFDGFGSEAGGGDPAFTVVSGWLRADVASVKVNFHRSGQRRTVTPVSGQLSAEDAATLHSPRFGRFLLVVGGCVTEHQFKVVAFAADGTRLGSVRGDRTPGWCPI